MTNLQTQLNEQLDRIWGLVELTLTFDQLGEIDYLGNYYFKLFQIDDRIGFYDEYDEFRFDELHTQFKREILAAIMEARDENGEYVLKGGSKANLQYVLDMKVLEQYSDPKTIVKAYNQGYGNAIMRYSSPTLRDLYFTNCFGRSQAEIENLKLIKW